MQVFMMRMAGRKTPKRTGELPRSHIVLQVQLLKRIIRKNAAKRDTDRRRGARVSHLLLPGVVQAAEVPSPEDVLRPEVCRAFPVVPQEIEDDAMHLPDAITMTGGWCLGQLVCDVTFEIPGFQTTVAEVVMAAVGAVMI